MAGRLKHRLAALEDGPDAVAQSQTWIQPSSSVHPQKEDPLCCGFHWLSAFFPPLAVSRGATPQFRHK